MSWHEKERPMSFDAAPIEGLHYLHGDVLARRYQQDWVKDQKYPVVVFPSGLARELSTDAEQGESINVFGAFELKRESTRDQGYKLAVELAADFNYGVARKGKNDLLIFHPHSARGYEITYDNPKRQIVNIQRFPREAMELLDGESRAILPKLYSTEKQGLDAIAPVKFFTPDSNWTWYATEFDGKDTFFGLVAGFEVELGPFSLMELEGVRGVFGLPIERDLYFTPTSLRTLQEQHKNP